MSTRMNVPKIPHLFFRWYCRPGRYEELHGDLEELFYERILGSGITTARLLYWWDVIRCCQPYAWKTTQGQTNSNIIMFKNYYFTASRNMVKHKGYFLLNVSGLAIGIASFILISLYILNEVSYDRFHTDYDQVYRIQALGNINGQVYDVATSNVPLSKVLLSEYPAVSAATRVRRDGSWLVEYGDEKFYEERILFADSTFFEVFDFKLLKGNPETALVHPRSMLLTEAYAKKYFVEKDPMGRQMAIGQDSLLYTVTGILENVPSNSHLQFDMLGSMSTYERWNGNKWVGSDKNYTYVVLDKNADAAAFEEQIQEIIPKYIGPQVEYYTGITFINWQEAGNSAGFYLVPLKDIHLHSNTSEELEVNSTVSYLYIYGLIGFIILFIAIFNFVNLATAQSASRAREVGVRKVMGSSKTGLVRQFLFESIFTTMIAAFLAAILAKLLMPSFVDLVGKELAFDITSGYLGILMVLGLALVVGLLAGGYPAFILSAFQPAEVLKGKLRSGARPGWTRNVLVVLQFAASIMIITATSIIYRQIDFMLTKKLGFEKEQVLIVERPGALTHHLETFKNDVLKNPAISTVADSKTIPGKEYTKRSYRKQGNPETYLFRYNQVSFDYQELMGLELAAGRFFSEEYGLDSNAIVINETAAKTLGFDDPVGESLTSPWRKGELMKIIGVVKDYNIQSLHNTISPMALELRHSNLDGYISIKVNHGEQVRETIEHIEDTWDHHTSVPFDYFFFDEDYENLYQFESTTGKVFVIFGALSVFIACLGLIGLVTHTASSRKKEMGIRKILGASTLTLTRLLSNDITQVILVATAVAWPLAYITSRYWLQNFVEQAPTSPWLYVVSTLIVVVIGGLAISFQTLKTATANPVDSIRQE